MSSIASPLSRPSAAFIELVGSNTDLPAFVSNVRAIGSVAGDLDARVGLLEQAIMQDVSLATKVLRIANSVSGGAGVSSVKQAIMLLGFDRVRHLSTAASVFNQIEHTAPAVRDLMVESVLCANHSLQLSLSTGYARPELAYLCGLLHHLGETLVACYRPREYREWTCALLAGASAAPGDEVAHFTFQFHEVGTALATRWGIPDAVVRTMRPFRALAGDDERLHAITRSSADIARCVYGSNPSRTDVCALRTLHAPTLGLYSKAMEECMTAAVVAAQPTLSTMHVDLDAWLKSHDDTITVARARSERAQQEGAASLDETPTLIDALDAESLTQLADRLAPNDDDSPQEAKLREAVRGIVAVRQHENASFSVGAVTNATLRAACIAGYERGVLGISTDDFKMIRGRVGIGAHSTDLARNFLIRPAASFGPLGASLHARTDLFVEMTGADAKLYARDRLIKDMSPSQFALLPLVLDMRLLGCLYFDSTFESVVSSDTSKQLLRDLRDQLVAALTQHRLSATIAA